ncbi:hypothetical protein Sru01_06760 [Sphaerisporangium rufum]|uniref:Uncharacterized protein n=1 Tax=Sphaerisporangium rufum TaxID=1381558 RepID=A0A919QX38_9ACTN|nr:hypothetical protein [Sphaerisporangium rufum]GII75694.1 hypothetical protein Sru01_06760 [Sphaerisporangium rufum]
MSDVEPIDYEAVRQRFPWVGLGASGDHDLSARYREIMATAGENRWFWASQPVTPEQVAVLAADAVTVGDQVQRPQVGGQRPAGAALGVVQRLGGRRRR